MAFAVDDDGRIVFVNAAWRAFSGLADSIPAHEAWQLASVRLLGGRPSLLRVTGESGPIEFEAEMLHRGGSRHWVRVSVAARSASSTARGFRHGAIVDIDDYKRQRDELRDKDQRLADAGRRFLALAEAIPVICWTADANGWIDWYNKRWYEYTGQSPREAAGWGWQSAHHPDDFLEVMHRWPDCIATGAPFEMEFRLRRHDGIFHWFLTRAEPMREDDGTIARWYGSNVDIDAQKRALEKSQRVAETLQRVFLPTQLPERPTLRMDATYVAAERDALIGGDWFDATEMPDGRILVSIGDVAGHGLSASMSVGRLRQTITTLAFQGANPARILTEMDTILMHQDPDTIVTALIAFLDKDLTNMSFASAGHPAPLIARRNDASAQSLASGGPPLGSGFPYDFQTHNVMIERDAVIAMYTDGMIEFTHDPIAGEEKLKSAVALMVGAMDIARPAVAVREIVFNGQRARDDAALLLLQFSAPVATSVSQRDAQSDKTWRFHSSDVFTAHAIRHEIMKFVRGMATDHDGIFVAELVIGEIIANTAEHAPGLVEIEIDWTGENPVLTVRDAGPGIQHAGAKLPLDELDEGGRGLYLIHSLSKDASVRALPGFGTEVRVVLDLQRRPESPARAELLARRQAVASPEMGPW